MRLDPLILRKFLLPLKLIGLLIPNKKDYSLEDYSLSLSLVVVVFLVEFGSGNVFRNLDAEFNEVDVGF